MTLESLKLHLACNLEHIEYEISKNRKLFLDNDISVQSCSEREIYLKGYKDALNMIFDKFKE